MGTGDRIWAYKNYIEQDLPEQNNELSKMLSQTEMKLNVALSEVEQVKIFTREAHGRDLCLCGVLFMMNFGSCNQNHIL